MEVMNGYKNSEVGLIPEDWEVRKFGELTVKIIGGGTPSRSNPKFWGNEIPWVTVKDFTSFNSSQTQEYITKEGLEKSASHLIPKGVIITSTRMALGKAVIYNVDVSINQDLKAIFPSKNIITKYFYFWFQLYSKEIEKMGSGSTVMGISLPDLKKIKVKVPPLPEQQAIAEVLSDTDNLIQALEKQIAKKRLIKQGVMQKLLTPKDGWEVKPLNKIVQFLNGKAHEQFIDEFGEYVVINSKFVSTCGRVSKNSNKNLCPLKKGDITMVMSDIPNGKALAKCFVVPENDKYALNQRICALRAESINVSFLKSILNRNEYFLAFDSGTGQTNLKKGDVLNCPVPLPSTLEEQNHIATILSDLDIEIETLEEKLSKYKSLKQGLMQNLLTGKIRLITNETV